jgi:hypothetical protein
MDGAAATNFSSSNLKACVIRPLEATFVTPVWSRSSWALAHDVRDL